MTEPLDYIRGYLPDEFKTTNLEDIPGEILNEAYNSMLKRVSANANMSVEFRDRVTNLASLSAGAGPYFNTIQTFMTCIDRYNANLVPVNVENKGLTFITRPRLCLQSSNLRNNRRFAPIDTLNANSMGFAMRCLLDTHLGESNNGRYQSLVARSPLVDHQNPFLVPVCNALTSLSGLPDMNIQTTVTEGGFMTEAQQFAIGADDFNRATYQLNLSFKDIQHGPIAALFYYWLEYLRCVTRGIMFAYADDIDEQRLNYTVSIYRFTLDPHKQYIQKFMKATGCFPVGMNLGSVMQVNEGEEIVNAATNISVPFVANKIEYMDYAILNDFNELVRRYCPDINKDIDGKYAEPGSDGTQVNTLQHPNLPRLPITNFRGLPYISSDMHGYRMEFRRVANPVFPYTRGVDDMADVLMYMDLQRKILGYAGDVKSLYEEAAEIFTPEYLDRSKRYKNVDMSVFMRRVLNSTTTDSASFALPI